MQRPSSDEGLGLTTTSHPHKESIQAVPGLILLRNLLSTTTFTDIGRNQHDAALAVFCDGKCCCIQKIARSESGRGRPGYFLREGAWLLLAEGLRQMIAQRNQCLEANVIKLKTRASVFLP